MAIITPVVDGHVVNGNDPTAQKVENKTSLDKNAFLQLLVAEMQNQDPLEPTTNTEYISQLATFSSLEEMQNMTKSMDLFRASSLVGQEVYIKTTNAVTGAVDYVHGNVDFITYENGQAMVSVNGANYPLAEVDSIYDQKYSSAYDQAFNWTVGLNKLPGVNALTYEEKDSVYALRDKLAAMNDYERSFITKENQDKIAALAERMDAIVKTREDQKAENEKKEEAKEDSDKDTKPESISKEDASAGEGTPPDEE